MPDLPVAIGKHPFGGIEKKEVKELADVFVDQIIKGWMGA
tara:strand:- start:22236 stop:22355 length:120 start_codon:yes stop_codon:yes gene_type:complete